MPPLSAVNDRTDEQHHPVDVGDAPTNPWLQRLNQVLQEHVDADTPMPLSQLGQILRSKDVHYQGGKLIDVLRRHCSGIVTVAVSQVDGPTVVLARQAPRTPRTPSRDAVSALSSELSALRITPGSVLSDSPQLRRQLGAVPSADRARAEATTAELRTTFLALLEQAVSAFSKLDTLNRWLQKLGQPQQPSVTKAVKALRDINVNLFDLLECDANGTTPPIFKTVRELAQYSLAHGLIFPKQLAKQSQCTHLKVFLRKLLSA